MHCHIEIALWNKGACTGGLSFFCVGGLDAILEVTGSVVPLDSSVYAYLHVPYHNPRPNRFDPVLVSRKS